MNDFGKFGLDKRDLGIDVSVVVAARNEGLHLRDALESILSQAGVSFEVIFIDDNSTDNTFEIAQSFTNRGSEIHVFRNKSQGKCSAFNYGVSLANGRFVCIFAGDDIMPPGSLAERYAAVKNLPEDIPAVGLSKLVTMSELPKFDGHTVPRAPGKGALSGVSPLMNRKAVALIFPVPEVLPNEDTWMELAVLHMPGWRIVHSDIICCRWRVHQGNSINMTVSFADYNNKISVRMKALRLFYEKYGDIMDVEQRRILAGKVVCEDNRIKGSMIGVLRSPVALVDKLRALSITNALMYEIRRKLYGLLSGW